MYRVLIEVEKRAEEAPHCDVCEKKMQEAYLTPPSVTRASYRDGVKREGFKDAAEMMRLKAESYRLPANQRKDIKKEIDSISSISKIAKDGGA
jgi:hypothetical protein